MAGRIASTELRDLAVLRRAQGFQARSDLADAQRRESEARQQADAMAHRCDTLIAAWIECQGADRFNPDLLALRGAQLVEGDRERGHATELLDIAERQCGNRRDRLRMADLAQDIAEKLHENAQHQESKREEEGRLAEMADRFAYRSFRS